MDRYYAFYAALEPCSDGFGVYFPDLPGAISGGINKEDAEFNAQECLAVHIHGMAEDGDSIPLPSPRDKIKIPNGQSLVLVSTDMKEYFPEDFEETRGGARPGAGRPKNSGRQATKRLVVRLTADEDETLTRLAVASQKTKSEYVRDFIAANG